MMKGTRFRGALLNACIGAMIFILLGSVWAVFGLWSLHGKGALIIAGLLGVCALLLLMVGIDTIRKVLRLPPDDLSMEVREHIARTKRRFGIVNAIQGVAIGATFMMGFNLHHAEYIPPIVALIVGLHFFALAPILRRRFDYITGALLCLLALTTLLMLPVSVSVDSISSDDIFLWGVVTGIGSAIMLWMGAVSRLINARRGVAQVAIRSICNFR